MSSSSPSSAAIVVVVWHSSSLVHQFRSFVAPNAANNWSPLQHSANSRSSTRQQLALTGFAANDRACQSKACLPSMPPPDITLPRILPKPQATWQRQGVNFELLKQSVMHDFGVVLLFGSFFYLLPLCCWFELPPTAGQQCCFWSG